MSREPRIEDEELLLEFQGCIVPLTSDKSRKPAKLTREQSRQLAEIIYLSFKTWYAQ
ncbi:MAG TPA: hypothetical protein PLA92_03525 [Fimbriimonadaceae bacterium]|nr:hypothetical protein [Fimbriimonadaceae bacterium]